MLGGGRKGVTAFGVAGVGGGVVKRLKRIGNLGLVWRPPTSAMVAAGAFGVDSRWV
jgi:hypothetical protein